MRAGMMEGRCGRDGWGKYITTTTITSTSNTTTTTTTLYTFTTHTRARRNKLVYTILDDVHMNDN